MDRRLKLQALARQTDREALQSAVALAKRGDPEGQLHGVQLLGEGSNLVDVGAGPADHG